MEEIAGVAADGEYDGRDVAVVYGAPRAVAARADGELPDAAEASVVALPRVRANSPLLRRPRRHRCGLNE